MTENSEARVIIVGAGHGGGNMAFSLRQAGHKGPIALYGDEPIAPYHRPPLSKAYLKGTATMESLKLRPDAWYENHNVQLHPGRRVVAVDTVSRTVEAEDGTRENYDILVLATGSRARTLDIPGSDLPGIFTLRTIADTDALRNTVGPGRRLCIVGGGYIGLEAAASALALGTKVTLLEREARLLARVACEPLAAFFDKVHREHGLEILTDVRVAGFTGQDHVAGVLLEDGQVIECDAALVGVGAVLNLDLAQQAGLVCEPGGVVVDTEARTSDPHIYAVGDMTWRPMPVYNNRMFRLESVPNALEQARRAAHDIMGKPQPAHETPWFWSDQYDVKLQIAGVPFDSDRLVVRGSMDDHKFAIFHLDADNRIRAVEAVNMAGEFMAGRTLIADGREVPEALLADRNVSIKDIARGTAPAA